MLVMLANFTDEILTIPKATILGVAAEVSESLVDKIKPVTKSHLTEPTKPPRKRKNEALYEMLLRGKLDHLLQEERQNIGLLLRYAHVFHDETNDFKANSIVEHEIPIGDARPIRKPPYWTPYAFREDTQRQVQKMLDRDIIKKAILHAQRQPS